MKARIVELSDGRFRVELCNANSTFWTRSPAADFVAKYLPHYKVACDEMNAVGSLPTVVRVVYP